MNSLNQILQGLREPTEEELYEILLKASDEYYNSEESSLTDAEYDAIEMMLRQMNPNHEFLAEVGSDVRGGKIKLPIPMGSLNQAYDDELAAWVKGNSWADEDFIITDKQDGISALLVYGPDLKIAYSRGNGIMGADITRHIKNFKNIPQKLSKPATLRVEVIVNIDDFKRLMVEEAAAGRRVYKNPRNYVAGRMNASESPQSFYDIARCIVTSVEDASLSKLEQLEFATNEGFQVTPHCIVFGSELTDDEMIKYLEDRRASSLTEIDGLVVDINNASIRNSLTSKSSSLNPLYAMKFKFGADVNQAVTKVLQVHWEASKSGYMKPRVQVEPVNLAGVTIEFATGFNASFIYNNGIGPGSVIQITRSGDVIPYIQKVVKPSSPQMPDPLIFGSMSWNDTEVDLVLDNPEDNDEVQLNKLIETFAALEIVGLREGSVSALYKAGFKTAASIITAPLQAFTYNIGESNGQKIYNDLKAKLNPIDLGTLAGASQMLGRGIGRRKMRKLVDALGSLDNLSALKIVGVEGFQMKTAETIMKNLSAFNQFLNDINGFYTLKTKEQPMSNELKDIVVVFTGVRSKDLEEVIRSKGGTIGSSFSSKTTHLVAKDPLANSTKLQKARAAGVEPMSLDEAWELWG